MRKRTLYAIALAGVAVAIVGVHALIYFSSWPHESGATWQAVSGIDAAIAGSVAFVACAVADISGKP